MSASNEESPMPTEMTKRKFMKKKKAKKPDDCLICGKFTNFKYYNVRSCNSCKQFFRRIVINQIQYFCLADGKCDLTKDKCRGCRLDKCLRLGMDPSRVNAENGRVFYSLEARRKKLMMDEKLNKIAISKYCHEFEREQTELKYFNGITNAHRRIWSNIFHNSGDILIQRIEQFQTFDEFLCSNLNVLSYQNLFLEQFQIYPSTKEEIIGEISQMQKITFHPRIRRKNILMRLLSVGIFKAILHYQLHQMPIEDQAILIIQNGPAIHALINTHFATQMGATAWSDPDGICILTKMCAKRELREDGRFLMLAQKAWVRPVKHLSGISLLSQEEFSILLAILCTHTAKSNISDSTKELLYIDQVRYSAFLLKYLQQKYGLEPGARRYAECMQMLEAIFFSAHNYDLLRTYLEAFHFSRGFTSEVFPRCIHPLV